MKNLLIVLIVLFCISDSYSQNDDNSIESVESSSQNVVSYDTIKVIENSSLSFVSDDIDKKELAKEISQYRSKEYIINNIIGSVNANVIKFEVEGLVSDNDAGLVLVAFNCSDIDEKGLLLAFFGNNKDKNGNIKNAYAFKYIPLEKARNLLDRIDSVKIDNKKYLSDGGNVNNVYIEFEDIKFVLYKDGGINIRVFWNGFELIWEDSAFDKTKKRLNKWFE